MRITVCATAISLSIIGLAIADPAGASMKKPTEIPAQRLDTALKQFMKDRELHIIYVSEDVRNLRSGGAAGNLTTAEALTKLLSGTNLVYKQIDETTIAIVRQAFSATGQRQHPSPATQATPAPRDGSRAGHEGKPQSFWQRFKLAQAEKPSLGEGIETRREGSDPAKEGSDTKLDEVIVTARRREESQQQVPVAVTVISQDRLRDNNVQTIDDLQYLVPAMSVSSSGTRDGVNVAIRGQGANSTSGQPGVIAYTNEVPLLADARGNLTGGPGLFFDLENVEVLKGPQGTLFGRNSVGGALLMRSVRPAQDSSGRLQVGYGDHENREIDGAINLPIVPETLLTRVAFNSQQRDGFTRILATPDHPSGVDVDNLDYWSVRGTVSFSSGGRFQSDTIITYQEYENDGSPNFLTLVNASPTGCGGSGCPLALFYSPAYTDLRDQQEALGTRTHLPIDTHIGSNGRLFSAVNLTRVDLGETLTLRNIFGYVESTVGNTYDSDATALPIFQIPFSGSQTVPQYTEELQLLGQSFGGHLEWVAGAFYLDQPRPDEFAHSATVVFGSLLESGSKRSSGSKALYAQGTRDLSGLAAGLSLVAGGRYTWDESFSCTYDGPAAAAVCGSLVRAQSSALTWTVGLNYQATPATLLYLTSRRGYRAGGTNLLDSGGEQVPNFDPEHVNDIELGLKSDWQLGVVPLRTNLALYYQDYTDIQVQQFIVDSNGQPSGITANAAEARIYGGEFEGLARLTDDWQLGINFTYLDFEYTETDSNVNLFQLATSRKGNRPPIKYGINTRYRLPLSRGIGDVSLQAAWNWQDDSGDVNLNFGGQIASFGLLNLALNWDDVGGRPIDASFYMSNVTDKTYSAGGFGIYDLFGAYVQRYGTPRMYGVRLRYGFGE